MAEEASEITTVELDRSGQGRVVRIMQGDRLIDSYSAAYDRDGHPLEVFVDRLADEVERLQSLVRAERSERDAEIERTIAMALEAAYGPTEDDPVEYWSVGAARSRIALADLGHLR